MPFLEACSVLGPVLDTGSGEVTEGVVAQGSWCQLWGTQGQVGQDDGQLPPADSKQGVRRPRSKCARCSERMWMQAGDVGRGVAAENRCLGEGSEFKCSGKESVAQRKASPGGGAEVGSEERVCLMESGPDAGGTVSPQHEVWVPQREGWVPHDGRPGFPWQEVWIPHSGTSGTRCRLRGSVMASVMSRRTEQSDYAPNTG